MKCMHEMKQVLILLFLLMLHVSKAFACSPAGEADPWYLYDFKVDQNTLPEGVSVVSKPLLTGLQLSLHVDTGSLASAEETYQI